MLAAKETYLFPIMVKESETFILLLIIFGG